MSVYVCVGVHLNARVCRSPLCNWACCTCVQPPLLSEMVMDVLGAVNASESRAFASELLPALVGGYTRLPLPSAHTHTHTHQHTHTHTHIHTLAPPPPPRSLPMDWAPKIARVGRFAHGYCHPTPHTHTPPHPTPTPRRFRVHTLALMCTCVPANTHTRWSQEMEYAYWMQSGQWGRAVSVRKVSYPQAPTPTPIFFPPTLLTGPLRDKHKKRAFSLLQPPLTHGADVLLAKLLHRITHTPNAGALHTRTAHVPHHTSMSALGNPIAFPCAGKTFLSMRPWNLASPAPPPSRPLPYPGHRRAQHLCVESVRGGVMGAAPRELCRGLEHGAWPRPVCPHSLPPPPPRCSLPRHSA